MHTDDQILQSFVAAKGPLPTIALDLGMTFIALVQWIDRNADLLAVAKRAMETHIAFLALRAEAAALIDLTQVSTSTTNEERKRKSASQLLRHSAKRLLTAVGAPPLPRGVSPPSPRSSGEKSPSEAKGMRGVQISPSVNPASLHNLVASGVPPVPTSSTTNPPREDLLRDCSKGLALGGFIAHASASAVAAVEEAPA